jgi:hypothetical protein
MSSPKLFLEFMKDGRFHVIDENKKSYGSGYEVEHAIHEARKITNEPIDFGDSFSGASRLIVTEKPENAEADADQFITQLAEIGGMKVIKNFNDKMNFIGYTMELIE